MGDMWILLIALRRFVVPLLRYLRRGIFLVPVAAMGPALFGVRPWTIALVLLAVVLVFWRPVIAAALLPVSMVIAGVSGLVVAATTGGSGFWTASALAGIRQQVLRGPRPRPPALRGIVRKALAQQHRVVVNQLRPARTGTLPAASRLNFTRVPGGPGVTAVTATPGPKAVTVFSGPKAVTVFPAPKAVTVFSGPKAAGLVPPGNGNWQSLGPGGGGAIHITAYSFTPGGGLWLGGLLVPLALLLLTLGLWLLPRSAGALRDHCAGLLALLRQRMLENRWGTLLIPVALLGLTVFGVHVWTVALVLVCAVTAARWPVIAADLVPVLLTSFAVRGFMIAASWQPLPPGLMQGTLLYGGILVSSRETAMLAGAEASAFLVVAAWLVPRTMAAHARTMLVPGRDLELEGRVQRLTETRDLAVDHAATELRRIERDLHDGAQARLIALGMNLRAVERMLPGRPEAALALVAEARETSLRALGDLRDLVRGICPPVLADRGLGHAVRALALDTPFPVDLDIDLPGRLTTPVESACYFAVAEALANAVRHSGARRVHIRMQHTGGLLRVQVADDGAGGADPARGSGLRGVEQRLAAFDGILAVSSPPGGPTMIAMEVPCALSSPKTCSC